jgi:hypothetical protein
VLFYSDGQLLHCGAESELVLIEAVEQAGNLMCCSSLLLHVIQKGSRET